MKGPGILKGIIFAALASLSSGISSQVLPILFAPDSGNFIIVTGLSLAYLIFLLRQSETRLGRIVVMALWLLLSTGGWLLNFSLASQIMMQLSIIWIVRSLYFHTSIFTALLDLVLIVMASGAGLWAILQTGSFITGVWCFFLAQSLFVAIPEFANRNKTVSGSVTEDQFQNARRVAQQAVRKLSLI